jgi:hypothetical protein
MLNVIRLSVIILIVIMQNVIILSNMMLNVNMLNAEHHCAYCHYTECPLLSVMQSVVLPILSNSKF